MENRFNVMSIQMRTVLVMALMSLAAGCDAQKPVQSPTTVAAPKSAATPQFSEPGLTAKIVDAVTKQALEGALIFGYHATQTGGVGGGRGLAEQVRSFETQTDADGVFTLPAWNTGDRVIKGDAMSLFPMIAIYKPGYEMVHQNGKSIAQWRPKTGIVGTTYELKDNVYDWTKYPYVLQPAKTEQERYFALNDSSMAMMFIGECGWEAYAKTLLVQHEERKAMIREFVPRESIGNDGYIKSGAPRTQPHVEYLTRTTVDNLIDRFDNAPATSPCANPRIVFGAVKK